ncbi:MAG: dihydroorotase [Gammaproteobacteria bacterium]|nr:MAG: dihydroorotase [Gammaproteobacteria bacterium]
MRLSVTCGRLVDPASGLDQVTDLHLADGRVVALGEPPEGFVPEQVLDAAGLLVLPGIVDLGVSLPEPGGGRHASLRSEAPAAARGGITTLIGLPDTTPVIDNPAVVELIHQRADAAGGARVLCSGALTQGLMGERLADMATLRDIGCVAVSNARSPIVDSRVLRCALEYAATVGVTVLLFPAEAGLADGVVHEGAVGARLGLPGVPETAETIALARALLLVEASGARVHFCRISSARGAQMVAEARDRGLPVSADVSINHLWLDETAVEGFDTSARLDPPLRAAADRQALRAALADGGIDLVCSDHRALDADARLAPFSEAPPGASGVDLLLPLTLELVEEGLLSLSRAVEALTGAATLLGLPGGSLSPGAVADLALVDPDAEWLASPETLASAGSNTPFLGRDLRGRCVATLIEGEVVWQAGADWSARTP